MTNEKLSIGIVESCVDYVRLSIPTTAPDYQTWRDVWEHWETQFAYDGCEQETFSMRSYNFSGYGGVAHATHKERALFQAAGPVAHHILEETKNVGFTGRCTRADTKISAQYDEHGYREATWRLATQCQETETRDRPMPQDFDLFQRKESGSTIYFDRDSASSFARAYQATLRHPDRYPPRTVSFEIQNKKPVAHQAFNMLRASSNLSYCAASLTIGRLDSLDVREFWRGDIVPTKAPQIKHKSTKAGTLKWIKSNVNGAFRRSRQENWHDEFLVALGFDSLTDAQALEVIKLLEASNPSLKLARNQQCLKFT